MAAIRQLLKRIRESGVRRSGTVKSVSMGREREFDAYDVGEDTFIFERGISKRLGERPSVLVAAKSSLRRRARGYVLTMTTGNHSTAAFPLLDGRFWKLSRLPSDRRGNVLMREILCANVVGDTIEISQREVPTQRLVEGDAWLRECVSLGMSDVVMSERNDATLAHFRRLGQEWRVKPLAWTDGEMRIALAASKKRIASAFTYYHSVKGVHFLTFSEFRRVFAFAQTDPDEFIRALRELVGVFEGNRLSFARMPKFRGHHEIEFFGIVRGQAQSRLVPELETLMEAVVLGRLGWIGVIQKAQEMVATYESLLAQPEFVDETSTAFVEALYMCITGEIYAVAGEGSTPAFDDRRTALPGATFVDGRPVMHAGADARSEVLLSNLRGMMSKDEKVEYANIYELRNDDVTERPAAIGRGSTREIVYKTNQRPLESSFVEKRLSSARAGYGAYMLARIGALKALGVSLSGYYRLLRRRAMSGRRPVDYYIRQRCAGEPMDAIPQSYFRSGDDGAVEDPEVVLSLATLMGDAAAQNLAMKKFDRRTESPLFGVGKEIYEFEFDIQREHVMPKRVATCSVRGSLGWPDLSRSDANLEAMISFYLQHYAHALKDYQRRHSVPMAEVASRFMDGFEFRIHALAWQLAVMRDDFAAFVPSVPREFGFVEKWNFALWALERHERRLPTLRKMFFEKVNIIEKET